MGLSLRGIGRKLTDFIGGTNNEAGRRSIEDANRRVQSQPARYGVLAQQPARQQFTQQNQASTFNIGKGALQSAHQAPGKALPAFGAGLARSAVGTAEGLSGLYDLATPGVGTSRFTKNMVNYGGNIDKFVKDRGFDNGAYKVGQVTGEAVSFLAPSGTAAVVGKAGKIGKAAATGGKGSMALNAAIATARGSGYRTARGKDVSPQTVATDLAMNAALGYGLNKVGAKLIDPAKKAVVKLRSETPGSPALAQLKAQKAASIKAMDTAPKKMLKEHVKNVNNIDKQIKSIEQGGYVKLPEGKPKVSAKTDPLEALKQEARKYKSADDYQLTTGDKTIDPKIKQIVEMSPDEYLKQAFEATDGRLGGDYESWLASNAQDALVAKQYAEAMLKGDKFPLAYIDKAMGSQDGRNRAIAAKLAGRDKMPVGIVPEMTKAEKISWLENKVKQYPEKSYLGNKYRRELTDLYNQAKAGKMQAEDIAINKRLNERPENLRAIEQSKVDLSPEARLKLTQGDTGQAGLQMKQSTRDKMLAEYRAKAKMNEVGGGDVTNSPVINKLQEGNLSIGQKLSPDRLIREKITNPLEQKVQKAIFNAQTSENPIARGAGRLAQGVSREAGVTNELLTAKRKLHGGMETGKLLREDIADAGKAFDKASKERVWATLDPSQAAKTGTKRTVLTPEESAYRDSLKTQLNEITQGNLERGLITPEQAANGDYIKRGYSIFEDGSDASKAYDQTKQGLLKQFQGRKDVTGELLDSAIKDPSYLVAKKAAESHAAWAMSDYGKYLNSSGLTSATPRPGYVQLPTSKVFGDAAGQYVPKGVAEDFTGFQYNNGIISAFNDMITAYDSLGIRRAKKELLTIFNPAVRTGNQFSNRFVFSNLNGINPVQFNKNMVIAKRAMKNRDPLYREAVEQGLTGLDITQADFAKRIADATGEPNLAVKAIEYAKKSYSAADDQSRLAAYITHRNRGYSPEEAARLTQRGFQDYNSVGFFYDMAAKTPLIGNAFVRFAGDATRIAKNAALDHPLRAASTIALWATFVNGMSKLSGETPEDKKTREDRFGAPKLPFTDISTAVQTPWGEVNVSRFLPFYQLNETQGSLSKLLPLPKSPVTFKDGKLGADPAAFNDPLLGQFVQLAADKDFRGKSIRDPENTGQFNDALPADQQRSNVAKYLAVGNLPVGREIDSLVSAARGKGDIYGRERSLPQAGLRALGVKIEQQGPEQQKKQRSTNDYFAEKEEIDKQIKGLPPKDQEAYKRLTGYYKLREKTTNEFDKSKQRYVKEAVYDFPEDKWKEYTTSPKLYDLAVAKKENDAKRQGTPIQPEFDKRLSSDFRKQLINNKSLAPGEDVEADERLYNSSEWEAYQKIKDEYTAKAKNYYPESDGEFKDELVKHKTTPFPKKPPAKVAYDEAYAKYSKGQGAKPQFNDAVAAAKDQYAEAKRQWTNTERKARGLPPISKEVWDNVTFGFESDEEKVYKQLKYGKGYGGYGFGNGSPGSPLKYRVSANAGGRIKAAPKVSVKIASAPRPKSRPSKPKVSIKKSLV